jgi:hypothetical protein
VTVHTDNKRMNQLMKEAAGYLGIKGHVVGFNNPKKIFGPGDIEGNHATNYHCANYRVARD